MSEKEPLPKRESDKKGERTWPGKPEAKPPEKTEIPDNPDEIDWGDNDK